MTGLWGYLSKVAATALAQRMPDCIRALASQALPLPSARSLVLIFRAAVAFATAVLATATGSSMPVFVAPVALPPTLQKPKLAAFAETDRVLPRQGMVCHRYCWTVEKCDQRTVMRFYGRDLVAENFNAQRRLPLPT